MAKNNKRVATVLRKTAETDIALTLAIDGRGRSEIATGVPFFDHMLTLFAKHGLFDLTVKAKGDVEVDYHHTVEDVGLVLGQAFKEALGDKVGIKRYGFFILPMDESLDRIIRQSYLQAGASWCRCLLPFQELYLSAQVHLHLQQLTWQCE